MPLCEFVHKYLIMSILQALAMVEGQGPPLVSVGSCFGQDPSAIARCQVADINCDGMINMTDLPFVSGSFGQTVP